jgi:hypothetical protein
LKLANKLSAFQIQHWHRHGEKVETLKELLLSSKSKTQQGKFYRISGPQNNLEWLDVQSYEPIDA